MAPLNQRSPHDSRPHIEVHLNGIKVDFLIDTGASLSVISEEIYRSIPEYRSLKSVPVEPGLKLSAASGHLIEIVGRFRFRLSLLGINLERSICVVKGLSKSCAILGFDFLRETQLVVTGHDVFFEKIKQEDWASLSILHAPNRFCVPARSTLSLKLCAKDLCGNALPVGTAGVNSAAKEELGVWNTLDACDWHGQVSAVVVNTADRDKYYQNNEVVGLFDPVAKKSLISSESIEERIDAIFNSFSNDPKGKGDDYVPPSMSSEEKDFLLSQLNVSAPVEWKAKYIDLVVKYHDVCSKGKFDLGRTDVIEHKVTMKTEEPIHIRQFRIPLEHRQTIYDWVDELLKKRAIEVSRSRFNSPIFLVPKPHGHGMRAVLDFRAVNLNSVPDRYTIREVRDCVDEVGLAGSKVFSTIDLTSGFWQQSLEEGSRQYTAFTVPGKGTRYQWTVTPMGLQGSPASFARLIDYVMRELKNVITYIDDVLSHSRDHQSQLNLLEKVFKRLRRYDLRLNIAKSTFGASEVNYLGYTITGTGIRPGIEKLEAVKNFQMPNSVKKIREFVGLANYFRFLIPHFSENATQLTKLTKSNSGYKDCLLYTSPSPRDKRQSRMPSSA